MERRYTVAEIDQIRAGIRRTVPYPDRIMYTASAGGGMATMTVESRSAMDWWERTCEDQLRTALVAGVDPAEYPLKP